MLFDTGPKPKGLGVIEVDTVLERMSLNGNSYRVGKIRLGADDELSYIMFANGTVGILQKSVVPASDKMREKNTENLLKLCRRIRRKLYLAELGIHLEDVEI